MGSWSMGWHYEINARLGLKYFLSVWNYAGIPVARRELKLTRGPELNVEWAILKLHMKPQVLFFP